MVFTTDSENRHLHIILSSLYLINIVTPGPRGRLNAHQTPKISSSVIIVAIAYGIQPAKTVPIPGVLLLSVLYLPRSPTISATSEEIGAIALVAESPMRYVY